jgi:hypothetical protein
LNSEPAGLDAPWAALAAVRLFMIFAPCWPPLKMRFSSNYLQRGNVRSNDWPLFSELK